MTCIRPRASAASVPGRGWMCQSDRRGGRAPVGVDGDDRRAGLAGLDHQAPEVAVGVGGVRAPVDDELALGHRHRVGPEPARGRACIRSRATPAEAQIVRSSFDAPSRWKNRRSRLLDWSLPIVP